jgi:hypothetical protein
MVRSRRPRLVPAALLALLLPCACSLVTSLDGLSGGETSSPDAAPRADAMGDVLDASAADGEAAADAAGPFCSSLTTAPAFCADFDGFDPAAGWTATPPKGATIEPSTLVFRSAPRAARSSLGAPGQNRFAFLERSFASSEHVRLSYSIYIDERPTVSEYEVNFLSFGGNGAEYDFYLAVDSSGARYVEQIITDGGGPNVEIPLAQSIPTRTWTRVVLDVTLVGARVVVVTVDGVEAARQPVAYAQAAAPVTARAGITYANASTDRGTIFVDDFVVGLK